MEHTIKSYLGAIEIGEAQQYKNLHVFPILSGQTATLDYLTLDEALSASAIEILEISQGGSVPELKLVNRSSKRVLILDGEELVGAKQNRVVNTTIMVEANTTTVIPVSCVEAHRWSYNTERFRSEERILSADLRAMKSRQVRDRIRAHGEFRSDQGAIWQEIHEKAHRMSATSPSMAMSEIYKKETGSIRDYSSHFSPVNEQAGAVFGINGEVVGLDSFDRPEMFSKVFNKLLGSYALDAIDRLQQGEPELKKGAVSQFLEDCFAAQMECRPSVGLGVDCRLESDKVTGLALLVEDKVLHLSAFRDGREGLERDRGTKMRRASERRRHRAQ